LRTIWFSPCFSAQFKFPPAVKNLTTAGVILEILHLDEGLKTDNFKGCGVTLKIIIIDQDDRTMVEVPGKILWIRNREGDSGVGLKVVSASI